jgi:hypothetical protein
LSFKHLEAIREVIEKNVSNKKIELPENYFFIKDRDFLIFYKNKLDIYVKKFSYQIKFGEEFIIGGGFIFKISKDLNISPDKSEFIKFSNIDINAEFSLKNYSPELKFLPFGKKNEVKLKDFLDKKKIPELHRKSIILFYINDLLVWIVGIFRSNHFLVNSGSNDIFIAQYLKQET